MLFILEVFDHINTINIRKYFKARSHKHLLLLFLAMVVVKVKKKWNTQISLIINQATTTTSKNGPNENDDLRNELIHAMILIRSLTQVECNNKFPYYKIWKLWVSINVNKTISIKMLGIFLDTFEFFGHLFILHWFQ